MPSVPNNSFQLVMVLAFLVPGSVYQFVRARLRGPEPDDSSSLNRVLRALTFSAALVTSYALFAGRSVLELVDHVQGANREAALEAVSPLAAWALTLLFVVPAGLAGLVFYLPRWGGPKWPSWLRLTYDPMPRAWDYAFNAYASSGISATYVRVLTNDGRYLGGWFGDQSYASSFPEPRELFIEIAHQMSEDGEFGDEVEGSSGLYIRCDDVRALEFVDPPAIVST
jgi:Family of unknown function (DUF6338)